MLLVLEMSAMGAGCILCVYALFAVGRGVGRGRCGVAGSFGGGACACKFGDGKMAMVCVVS